MNTLPDENQVADEVTDDGADVIIESIGDIKDDSVVITSEHLSIPDRLNSAVVVLQMIGIVTCFYFAGQVQPGWPLALLALFFALLMVSVYSTIHEAEHGILFSRTGINNAAGVWLALFFPAPFHLIRQGHLGHHQRNRSDDEAFDLWFDDESALWKWAQWLGILTGVFYLTVVLSSVVVLILPFLLHARWFRFDRPSRAFMDSLNPAYVRLIRLESIAILLLHPLIVWGFGIPVLHYLAIYAAFGFLWSSLQYVHHFGAQRHVTRGAFDLYLFQPLDLLWLNHNRHLTHHLHPTVSWVHLERIGRQHGHKRRFLPWVYLTMWRGPRRATERVQNRFAGKVIR